MKERKRNNPRKPGIKHRHARLEQPQERRIQRPTNDLRLGSPDAPGVLLRERVEFCALGGRHGVVREPAPPGADAVGGARFDAVDYLFHGFC
jgi:hypothetical protein